MDGMLVDPQKRILGPAWNDGFIKGVGRVGFTSTLGPRGYLAVTSASDAATTSQSIGLKVPLLDPSAAQAVRAQIKSISARNSMASPGFDRGGSTETDPSEDTSTRMKMLNVVEILSGPIPKGAKALARFSKQLG
jgi:hypothetical protein